jgi:hypothetical protein
MKMNRTVGLLALAMAALSLTQCKKEDKMPIPQTTAKESTFTAKDWLAGQQAELAKSGRGIQFDAAGKFNWNSPVNGTDGSTQFIPIATDNQQMAKYLKLTKTANGAITGGNYVYLYPIMQQEVNAYLLEGKKIPADFNCTILEYGLDNQLLAAKVYEKGTAVANKTAKLAFKPTAKDKGNATTSGNAAARVVCYEYYMQTFVNGLLVTEVYLYTMCYGTPDATLENEGGGGGAIDESAALMAEFNNHIKSSSTPAAATVPETTPQPDPISFTHDWIVVEGAVANWKVMATTRMDYYHKKYYDIQLNAIEHRYDIIYLKTANVQYVGSNTFITTTWTTTSILDNIQSNNTSNAYGKSHVFGKLKHRANFNVPNPLNPSSPIVPDAETAPNNYCITLAR